MVPFIVTNTEFVKAAESNYKINEIINEDGVAEIVIRVLENGEYITIPFQSQDVASTKASTCQHMNLSAYNSYKQTREADTDDMCYKVRVVSESKCINCGKTGFKHYGTWTQKPHDYPLFGKTCKTCGKSK